MSNLAHAQQYIPEVVSPGRKTERTCNICGYPKAVTMINPETQKKDTVTLECLDHPRVYEYLWNKHPKYDWYHQWKS